MITDDDIRRAVSRNAFDAGREYFLAGLVVNIGPGSNGRMLEGRVQGSGRKPYRQTIMFAAARGGAVSITGDCTCPVGFNCKHVAAALFAYQKNSMGFQDPRAAEPRLSPSVHGSSYGAGPTIGPGTRSLQSAEPPLPYEVDAWLRGLEAAQEIETEDYPPSVRKRLLYVLSRGGDHGRPLIDVQSIELKSDGSSNGRTKRYDASQIMRQGQQPKFLRPSDRAILQALPHSGAGGPAAAATTLRTIIVTGRGRWGACNGPVLVEGEPVKGELRWVLADDGLQRPTLELPEPMRTLHFDAPWYIDPATGVMGPVETEMPNKLLQAMLSGPTLTPALAERVRAEMARRWPAANLPTPAPIAPPQLLQAPLQPRLELLTGELPFDPAMLSAPTRYRPPSAVSAHKVPLARLSWQYGPVKLPDGAQVQAEIIVQRGGVLLQVKRDMRSEAHAAERLRLLSFSRIGHYHLVPYGHQHAGDMMLIDSDPGAWIDFMIRDLPQLRADGWLIDVANDFPLRLVESTGEISFEIREHSGIDWFDLDLGVMVDGVRISLTPALLNLIAETGVTAIADESDQAMPFLLPLPDGRLLTIPRLRLQAVLAPLLELLSGAEKDEQAGTVRLSRRNAADLALLEAASAGSGIAWTGGDAVRTLGRQLREHGGIPLSAIPESFTATLRGYQELGLAWLQFLRAAGLGGILADDMGLGKTVQALAHLAIEQAAGRLDQPALVICPTSLVGNWQAEAKRFAPRLRILVLHGSQRAGQFDAIRAHDLVITTYPLLARDHAVLVAQDWHVVLLDEAQMIKNPLATTSKLARTLRARQRLCLSGTPLENHLGELWSLFDFLMPGFLGDRQGFGRHYRTPIEKTGNTERQMMLARRIAPFLLRRTKEQVAPDLPPKTEIAETVEMGDAQRAIYEGIRLTMHAKVKAAIATRGLAGSGIIILDALLKLRQACCDPRLLKLTSTKAAKAKSAKLERLLEMLPQLLEEGRRVLLFSQFTSMLALIEADLARLGQPYVLLTGNTKDRATPVRRFQEGSVPLFLISLKAGGVGLNLTAADTVIHYDPWWNPAVEDQATDRAHRIGQDKPVFVHRLITSGTIEEKMETLKQRKQAIVAGVLGGDAQATLGLTEGDLEMLFAPDGSA